MNTVYIGWDSREDIAYQVARHSIETFNNDVKIVPLRQHELRAAGVYWREIDQLASTEFTFTRFLVPYLNQYQGWAVFVDCDFLYTDDIGKLFDCADPSKAVQVVQHDYTPKETVKMDGQQQHLYPRKNWSSMILFNCAHPKNQSLTLENVNSQSGTWLHRFQWLNDIDIGGVSHEWNWLEGWYKEPSDGSPKAIHFTSGGPYFKSHFECEYHQDWKDAYYDMTGKLWTKDDVLDK